MENFWNWVVSSRYCWKRAICVHVLCYCYDTMSVFSLSLSHHLWRVNYLKSKNFSSETVASMVSRAPYLLNFSVNRLDNRLGFYQQQLSLSANNVCSYDRRYKIWAVLLCFCYSVLLQLIVVLHFSPDTEYCSSSSQVTVWQFGAR